MKQFLVPALLLALVGTAAAIGAGSVPVAATPAHGECHAMSGMSGECPFSGGAHCDAMKGGVECTPEMAEKCPMGGMSDECKKQCEESQDLDCCKKKVDCEKCEKHEAPVEKP